MFFGLRRFAESRRRQSATGVYAALCIEWPRRLC